MQNALRNRLSLVRCRAQAGKPTLAEENVFETVAKSETLCQPH
jgi:hypothetical protein